MKKLMILAIAMMATMNASAQIEEESWYFTPKIGINIADLTGKLYDPDKADSEYDSKLRPLTTFTAGVDFLYAFTDNLGISFGASYARQGAKTKDDLFHLSMDYVNIPLMLNYYPIANVGLAFKAGVQLGILTHKVMKVDGVTYDKDYEHTGVNIIRTYIYRGRPFTTIQGQYVEAEWSKNFNKVDCSIPLAVSFEYKGVQLEARYNLGLTQIMKDDDEHSKNSVFQFTLGYKFDLGD